MIADTTSTQTYQHVKPHLFSIAYRMTGSAADAEDLIQDAWIRYLDAGSPVVDSIRAYLTTIVSRLALDYLKSARHRQETSTGMWMPEPVLTGAVLDDPGVAVERREDVSIAFLMLLERLTPDQRVVYVLREALGMPYEDIASHVDKSAPACRQVFRRAQGRLHGERRRVIAPEPEHRALAEQFVDTVRSGDVARLATMLAEDVILLGDAGPDRPALKQPITGVDGVSRLLSGFARQGAITSPRMRMEIIDVNGAPAVVGIDGDLVDFVVALDVLDGAITGIRAVRDPRKVAHLARAIGVASPRH